MKILHVISSMNPKTGGVSQGLRNLNPYIMAEDIQVEVVCMDHENEDYQVNDQFVVYKIGKGKTSFGYNPKLCDWLVKHIEKYDYVVVHGLWQYHNYAVYKIIKKLEKTCKKTPKVAIMAHGMLDPYFQKAKNRKIKAIRNELIWRLTEKVAINKADALFFTCKEELLLAQKTFKGYSPKKEINIGFGIKDPPIFNLDMKSTFEQKCPGIKTKRYWLFISRIHPKKGVDILIDSYNKLTKENNLFPDLVIAGPVSSSYAKQMMEKAKNNSKIHFSGMLTGDSKWGAFYGCETYLLPSYQENFGIAIVEAMACKKPVVISKNINIWKEIEAGNGGWILNELNETNIYNTLFTISGLSDTEIIQKGNEAYETFQTDFNVKNRATFFVKALQEL